MGKAAWMLVFIAVTASTAAPARAQVATVDLLTDAGTQIDGAVAEDRAGRVAGDFRFDDGDEVDVLVGSPHASPLGRSAAGSASVLFGPQPSAVDLLAPAAAVRIDGAAPGDRTGIAVAGAGDVDADGYDDVVIGADGADPHGRADAGTAWVVFGGDNTPIDLAALGGRGFRIDGPSAGADAGTSVDGAGDVNGDGHDDLIVGAPAHDYDGRDAAGTAFVVFGKADTAAVDLANLGTGGYPIHGAAAGDEAGTSVAGAGQVDGDDVADLIVGAPGVDPNIRGAADAGAAYILYGKGNTTPVDLAALGSAGYSIIGSEGDANAGYSVDSAGDLDRDGHADQIIGAPGGGYSVQGEAIVGYGLPEPPTRANPLSTYHIVGAAPLDGTGHRVVGLGDVTGDLRPDHLVAAPDSDNGGRAESGSAFVVHGLVSPGAPIDLATFTETSGYRIDGPGVAAHAGRGVAAAGDADGERGRDVLVGAPENDANGRMTSGSAYLVHGASAYESISHVGVLPTAFRPPITGPKGVPAAAAARSAAIRFRLAEPALVRTTLYRQRTGRTRGRFREVAGELRDRVRCVRGRPVRRRGERRCLRFQRLGAVRRLRLRLAPGRHRVPFDGRLRGRRLRPGRYVVAVSARDRSGAVHGPKRADFRILR